MHARCLSEESRATRRPDALRAHSKYRSQQTQMSLHTVNVRGVIVKASFKGAAIPQWAADETSTFLQTNKSINKTVLAARMRRLAPNLGMADSEAFASKLIEAFKSAGVLHHQGFGMWSTDVPGQRLGKPANRMKLK